MEELRTIKSQVVGALERLSSLAELEALRVAHLGRSSALSQVLRTLKDKTEEERRTLGAEANRLREELEGAFVHARDALLDGADRARAGRLPPRNPPRRRQGQKPETLAGVGRVRRAQPSQSPRA